MPKDHWGNARARAIARHANWEYATEGRPVSYELVYDDLYPAALTVGSDSRRRPSGLAGTGRKQTTSRRRVVKARRVGSKGTAITIANVTVPASLVEVAVGRKYKEGGRWILTSKRGRIIGRFATEADLERWWAAFQNRRGRVPRTLRPGRASKIGHEHTANPVSKNNASANCICNPAWLV